MGELVPIGSKYSDDQRRQAVLEYLIHGTMSKVSKSMGIPETTLSGWCRSEWWDELTAEVRSEKDDFIIATLDRIIIAAFEATIDRLEHGDVILHRGEQIRVPVKGKDAAIIGAIAFDRLRSLRNQPTSVKGDGESMDQLLERFRQIARDDNKFLAEQKESMPASEL